MHSRLSKIEKYHRQSTHKRLDWLANCGICNIMGAKILILPQYYNPDASLVTLFLVWEN
jgi:hypothetical protein